MCVISIHHHRVKGGLICSVKLILVLWALLGLGIAQASELALSLDEAEALVLKDNPGVIALQSQGLALKEASVAAEQLPDPKLRMGAVALPLDSFDISQEPMTQLQLGVQQHFPRKAVRLLRRQALDQQADALQAMATNKNLQSLLMVREAYLDVFHWQQAGQIVAETTDVFSHLRDIARDYFASGQAQQHDVYRAELELSRIRDRLTRLVNREQQARAELSIWLADQAYRPLNQEWPDLESVDSAASELDFEQHPRMMALRLQQAAAGTAVEEARQAYKPDLTVDLTYGQRSGRNFDGSHRDDFISLMFTMDLPFFTGNRQDKKLASTLHQAESLDYRYQDELREMESELRASLSSLELQQERLRLYETHLLPEARNNAEATTESYQSAVADFTTLMRALITEYELKLAYLEARIEEQKTLARLAYLSGEVA